MEELQYENACKIVEIAEFGTVDVFVVKKLIFLEIDSEVARLNLVDVKILEKAVVWEVLMLLRILLI